MASRAAVATPTFSWAMVGDAVGYELVVLEAAADASVDQPPTLTARVPAGTSSWSPPAGELLPGRRYAWAVRALRSDEGGAGSAGEWSSPLWFEVPPSGLPPRTRLLLQRIQAGGPEAPEAPPSPADPSPAPRRAEAGPRAGAAPAEGGTPRVAAPLVGSATVAVQADGGSTSGILGVTDYPSGAGVVAANLGRGPDLVLSGKPGDAFDGTRIEAQGPQELVLESQATTEFLMPASGAFELTDSGVSLLYVDASGEAKAWGGFGGDGSLLTNLSVTGLACTDCVDGGDVEDGAITGGDIANGSLSGLDFGLNSLRGSDITPESLSGSDLALHTLTSADLGSDAAGASEIATDAVRSDHIASGAVGRSELATNSIRGTDLFQLVEYTTTVQTLGNVSRNLVVCDGECGDGTLGDICAWKFNFLSNFDSVDARPLLVDCNQVAPLNPAVDEPCGGDNLCEVVDIDRFTTLGRLCVDDFFAPIDASVSCLID